MRIDAARRVELRRGFGYASVCRDLEEGAVRIGGEDDRAGLGPSTAAPVGRVANSLNRTTRTGNPFQLPVREKRDVPGVGGPERVRGVLSPLDDPADGIVEIANPEVPLTGFLGERDDHRAAVRSDGERAGSRGSGVLWAFDRQPCQRRRRGRRRGAGERPCRRGDRHDSEAIAAIPIGVALRGGTEGDCTVFRDCPPWEFSSSSSRAS